jgi:energy-coupling factor transport system substrate-specific component
MSRAQERAPRWTPTLADLVLLATLAVVFGFLYWVFVQLWGTLRVAMGPLGDLAQNILIGGWFVVAPLAIYIIRKPLVGVVAETVAAIVEFAFLGSPVGPILLLTGLIQGAGSESVFALTRYRRYGWWVFAVSGAIAAAFSFAWGSYRFGWLGQEWLGLRLIFQLTSGIIAGGLLAKVIGDALLRTGVLDNYAIGRVAARG